MSDNCLFCKIINGDIPAETLYKDDDVLVFRDINPQAPVHLLVIPKKHMSGCADVQEKDEQVVGKMMRIGNEVALKEGIEHYRVILNNGAQAGQEIFHLHMHILGGLNMRWLPGLLPRER